MRLGSAIDATPAREHIEALIRKGASQSAIAAAVGASRLTVWQILHCQRPRIYPGLAAALLALTPAQCQHRGEMDPRPTLRILEELTDLGYTQRQLASWLGYSRQAIGRNQGNPRMTQRFAEAVAVLKVKLERGQLRRA